jgi:hypothetical protein
MIKTGGTCLALVLLMSSCYTVTHTVGTGSQGTEIVKKKNHYLIGGLAPLKVADTKEMANGKANYDITVTHTFVDGLIGAITFGLYSPTTTIVKK